MRTIGRTKALHNKTDSFVILNFLLTLPADITRKAAFSVFNVNNQKKKWISVIHFFLIIILNQVFLLPYF